MPAIISLVFAAIFIIGCACAFVGYWSHHRGIVAYSDLMVIMGIFFAAVSLPMLMDIIILRTMGCAIP